MLDFLYFFFVNYYVAKRYRDILYLLECRLSSFQLIYTSIISIFLFQKMNFVKFFSLFFIFISLIGIILTEFCLRRKDINSEDIKLPIFIFGSYLYLALPYYIEKILMEYDNSTPFQILFYREIFGNILMFILSFFKIENKFQ